jgi:hypothetical protein
MPYLCAVGQHYADQEGFCAIHNCVTRFISPPPGWLPPELLQHITSFMPVRDHVNFSSSSIVLRGTTKIDNRLLRAVQQWSAVQTQTVKTRGFGESFVSKFFMAIKSRPALHDKIIRACSFVKITGDLEGKTPVLVIRFFDGTQTGLLPPSESPYLTNAPKKTTMSVGSAEAHASGERASSPFVSLTGHLPSLMSTSCQAVRMIMFGPTGPILTLVNQGIKISGVHPRAAAIGVFLLDQNQWTMPKGLDSEKAHLAIQENEVLFDARTGSLAGSFLFKIDNLI